MQRDVLTERFFTALISGNRAAARAVLDEACEQTSDAAAVLSDLFWPTLEQIQNLYRNDQLSDLGHHYATRLMRMLVDQLQLQLPISTSNGKVVLLVCGPEEPEELAAQITADLLEAEGYSVYFGGGGVANDEIVEQIGTIDADVLMVFGAVPSTVPTTRLLIDRLHEIGVCPKVQVAVGGGIFNRAAGLAEEIGADIWARTPIEMVQVLHRHEDKRMHHEQRTVGRKRRTRKNNAA